VDPVAGADHLVEQARDRPGVGGRVGGGEEHALGSVTGELDVDEEPIRRTSGPISAS